MKSRTPSYSASRKINLKNEASLQTLSGNTSPTKLQSKYSLSSTKYERPATNNFSSPSHKHTSSFSRLPQLVDKRSSGTDKFNQNKGQLLINKSSLTDDSSSQDNTVDSSQENNIKAPSVSAKAWIVANAETGEMLPGRQENEKREVASVTKIMTCLCACRLIDTYKIAPSEVYVQVSPTAASLIGTSANLRSGDIISIWDLLHALMLPSGNDAAYCLAESFGTYLNMQTKEYKAKVRANPSYAQFRAKFALRHFLKYMNETAKEIGLKSTYYSNPHGLCDQYNLSTASDIAKLTVHAMKNKYFREVVRQQVYVCKVEQEDGEEKEVVWENTNKLLPYGWEGVKTGITTAAGPCFSGFRNIEGKSYVVVVLGCESMEARWDECDRLVKWAHEQLLG